MNTLNGFLGLSDSTENETRICRNCKQVKPVTEMESDRPHTAPKGAGYRNQCKECRKHIQDVISKIKKETAHLVPTIHDTCIICKKTGEELMEFTSQGPHKRKLPWVCDHDHETDEFRDYICFNCNTGLSNFFDTIESMERAILYLNGDLRNKRSEIT